MYIGQGQTINTNYHNRILLRYFGILMTNVYIKSLALAGFNSAVQKRSLRTQLTSSFVLLFILFIMDLWSWLITLSTYNPTVSHYSFIEIFYCTYLWLNREINIYKTEYGCVVTNSCSFFRTKWVIFRSHTVNVYWISKQWICYTCDVYCSIWQCYISLLNFWNRFDSI